MSRLVTKPTKWHVRPAKTQISLGIRPVWSESSQSAWSKLGSLATHWADSEDSDQTGQMPRLIWVFTGRTVILLVLSRGGSDIVIILHDRNFKWHGTIIIDSFSGVTFLGQTVIFKLIICLILTLLCKHLQPRNQCLVFRWRHCVWLKITSTWPNFGIEWHENWNFKQ